MGPLNWINPAKGVDGLQPDCRGHRYLYLIRHGSDAERLCWYSTTRYFRIEGDLSGCKNGMDDASEAEYPRPQRLAGQFIDRHEVKLSAVEDLLATRGLPLPLFQRCRLAHRFGVTWHFEKRKAQISSRSTLHSSQRAESAMAAKSQI